MNLYLNYSNPSKNLHNRYTLLANQVFWPMINSFDVLPYPEMRLSLREVKHRNIQKSIDEENLLNNNNGVNYTHTKFIFVCLF